MRLHALLLLALFAPPAAAQLPAPAVSPRAAALIAPVHQAYEKLRAEQASRPPARDTAEKLLPLRELDQVERSAMASLNLSALPKEESEAAMQAVRMDMHRHDRENQEELLRLLPEEGWFRISQHGRGAARDAFVIVQHAMDNPALMQRVLARMEAWLKEGDADGQSYALLYDRVLLTQGRPQRYGSQVICRDGKWQMETPLEDPAALDERRRQIGMKQTAAEYLNIFARMPCR